MTVAPQISTLEFSGLIRLARANPELEYIFRHALVQDAAYDSLLKSDRRTLHAAVAETLEGMYPGRLDEISATLADHHERAENFPQALRHYLSAARQSARTYANREAISLFERAIEISALPEARANVDTLRDLYTQYGRVLELSGRHHDAIEAYRQMQAEAIRRRDRRMELDALIAQAVMCATPTPVFSAPQAKTICEQSLELARALSDREAESRIYWILLLVHYNSSQNETAIEYGQKSLEIARAIHNRERIAFTLNDIARCYIEVNHYTQAFSAAEEARVLWEQMGNLPMLADNLASQAEGKLDVGELTEALQLAIRGHQISQKIDNQWGQGFSLLMQAYSAYYLGQWQTCLDCSAKILEIPAERRIPFVVASITSLMVCLYAELGDLPMAEKAQTAYLPPKATTQSFLPFYLKILQAIQASYGGQVEEPLTLLEEAFRLSGVENRDTFQPVRAGQLEYNWALATRRYDDYLALSAPRLQTFQNRGIVIVIFFYQFWRGHVAALAGRLDESRLALTAALEYSQRMGEIRLRWQIYARLGLLAAKTGDQPASAEYRQKARQALEEFIAQIPPASRPTFLQSPQVRECLNP